MAGGPIERIYSKIVDNNSELGEDVLALFNVDDFVLDYDFNIKLRNNASKRAVKWLTNCCQKLTEVFLMRIATLKFWLNI